jgi:pSer/pThr/pTyr-binding forkhead associated (FHA) protein
MSKLTLQFEGIVLRDFAVGSGLTIGRLPDNAVMIDNPAVSGHHARVFQEGDAVVLEDLRSTNGTFVNGRPVTRHVLRHGDEVLVGKHHLVYDQAGAVSQAGQPIQGLGDTVYLDTKQHRALRATLETARAEAAKPVGPRPAAPRAASAQPRRVGLLRVVEGDTDLPEYDLDAQTSIIGRSESALVRLRGWFKPSVAVSIARTGDSYVATPMGGRPFVNDERLTGRHHLEDGDLVSVSGLTLEFRWKDQGRAESAA